MNIILLGPPGSGKGTQAKNITSEYGFVQLSTGDMLRSGYCSDSKIGRELKAVMDGGNLVSDEIVIGIVEERIFQNESAISLFLKDLPCNLHGFEGPGPSELDQLSAKNSLNCGLYFKLYLISIFDRIWLHSGSNLSPKFDQCLKPIFVCASRPRFLPWRFCLPLMPGPCYIYIYI